MNPLRAFRIWRIKREIERALALRKRDRKWRSEAAHKGHETRRRAQ